MPSYRYIILDSYPLGNCAISISRRRRTPTPSEQCRQWLTDCERAGAFMLVPAIAYYEELREFERRQAVRKIERFQAYCFQPGRLIPLSTAHLESAARLW